MNSKPTVGPLIGSGVVVLLLIFGAVYVGGHVFKERTTFRTLPAVTEYERITISATSSEDTAAAQTIETPVREQQ